MKVTIEAKRRAAKLVQEKALDVAPLARRIGTSQSTLWNFLYGQTENFGKVPELSKELGVSIDWLLTGEGSAPAEVETGQDELLFDAVIRLAKNASDLPRHDLADLARKNMATWMREARKNGLTVTIDQLIDVTRPIFHEKPAPNKRPKRN